MVPTTAVKFRQMIGGIDASRITVVASKPDKTWTTYNERGTMLIHLPPRISSGIGNKKVLNQGPFFPPLSGGKLKLNVKKQEIYGR